MQNKLHKNICFLLDLFIRMAISSVLSVLFDTLVIPGISKLTTRNSTSTEFVMQYVRKQNKDDVFIH